MVTLSERWQEGDTIFVSYGAAPAFQFYAERYGLGDVPFHTSEATDYKDPPLLLSKVNAMEGNPRVWILMSHIFEQGDFNEKDYLLAHLDVIGEMKRELRKPGTGVYLYLYDLNQ
jgi:hypothetical protein